MIPLISKSLEALDFSTIPPARKAILQPLADYLQKKVNLRQPANLNFICTHNSRRSHLSQIWAQTAAAYYGITTVRTYSGGTEATAVFPVVIETLKTQGFSIQKLATVVNPIYAIKYDKDAPAIIAFSKTYDDKFNPKSNYAAIMTCDHAADNCPVVIGAEQRIPITYDDPKSFDHSPLQKAKYLERSQQIATELCYVFSQIKNQNG